MSPDLFNVSIEQIYAGYLLHDAWAAAGFACFLACLIFLLALTFLYYAEVKFGWILFHFITALVLGAGALISFSITHAYPSKSMLEVAVTYRISSSEKLTPQQKTELIHQFQLIWGKR